jgi:hypothetical protein
VRAAPAVVLLISADPRVSHRAAEAMRIGLGILAGEHAVTFVLAGAASHLLDADTDGLVDGDDVGRLRAALRGLGVPFHVEAGAAPAEADWNAEGHAVLPVTPDAIAELARRAGRLLAF